MLMYQLLHWTSFNRFDFSYEILNAPSEKIIFFLKFQPIFFQCCFMSETQLLVTVLDFSRFFSRNHFLEGGFTFQWGLVFSWWGVKKIIRWGSPMPPHYGKPCNIRYTFCNKNFKAFLQHEMSKYKPSCFE